MEITHAKLVKNHILHIKFINGEAGEVDFSSVFEHDHRPILAKLFHSPLFQSFYVDHGTLCWKNGADLSPEFIYELYQMQHIHHIPAEEAYERLRADGYM